MAQEISLGISAGSFGFVIGFLSGYAVRAYLSLVHRKQRKYHVGIVATGLPFGDVSECAGSVHQYRR
jgi:hypothetical protein